MANIKKIGNRLISIGKKIKKTFSDIFKTAKLKKSINKEKRNLNQFYLTMGKTYFEHYGTTIKEVFLQPVGDDIQQSLSKIEQIEGEIRFIQNIKICPHCGATCSYNNSFCPDCGNAFTLVQQTDNTISQKNIANQDDTNDIPVVPEIIEISEETDSQEIIETSEEFEIVQPQDHKSVNKAKNLRLFTVKHDEEQEKPPAANEPEEPVVTTKKPRKSSKEKK